MSRKTYNPSDKSTWPDHDEIVILMKDGTKDYVDPVYSTEEVDGNLVVRSFHEYTFDLSKISRYQVRKFNRDEEIEL